MKWCFSKEGILAQRKRKSTWKITQKNINYIKTERDWYATWNSCGWIIEKTRLLKRKFELVRKKNRKDLGDKEQTLLLKQLVLLILFW